MHCFCVKKMATGVDVRWQKFDEFMKENEHTGIYEPDETYYCDDWLINFALQQGAVVGTTLVIVIINVVVGLVLQFSSFIERSHTINDETMGQFIKLMILQFINIGLIILIVNFDFVEHYEDGTKGLFLGFIPYVFNGEF